MVISAPRTNKTLAVDVRCSGEKLDLELSDGRKVAVPLTWFPRLGYATQAERDNWVLEGDGDAIRWPDLDEDILVEGILAGRPSRESERSFKRWAKAKDEGRGLTLAELAAHDRNQQQRRAIVD